MKKCAGLARPYDDKSLGSSDDSVYEEEEDDAADNYKHAKKWKENTKPRVNRLGSVHSDERKRGKLIMVTWIDDVKCSYRTLSYCILPRSTGKRAIDNSNASIKRRQCTPQELELIEALLPAQGESIFN